MPCGSSVRVQWVGRSVPRRRAGRTMGVGRSSKYKCRKIRDPDILRKRSRAGWVRDACGGTATKFAAKCKTCGPESCQSVRDYDGECRRDAFGYGTTSASPVATMGEPRRGGCYDYVTRAHEDVFRLLRQEPLELLQRATTSASARARSLATSLRVELAGL